MIFKNLSYGFRILRKQGFYTLLNIIGLSIGIAIASIILIFIVSEFNFDTHQTNYNKVYIVYQNDIGENNYFTSTPFIFSTTLKNLLDKNIIAGQLSLIDWCNVDLKDSQNVRPLENSYYADPEIFKILDLHIIEGSSTIFFQHINSVLISKEAYRKYFNNKKYQIGDVCEIRIGANTHLLEIAGIFENTPYNSHFRPNFIFPMQLLKNQDLNQIYDWGFNNPTTYLLLNNNNPKVVEKDINQKIARFKPDNLKNEYHLLALKDVHLYTNDISGIFGIRGDINKIYFYSIVGMLILIIACINFINIYTAKSATRLKEFGIRKVIGANKRSIVMQILTETVLVAFLSLPLAVLCIELILPIAMNYLDRMLYYDVFKDWDLSLGILMIVLIVGIVSGLYSALMASKLQPVEIIGASNKIKTSKSTLRKILILLQFVIFSTLTMSYLIAYLQMTHINELDLGYNKNFVLVTNLPLDSISLTKHQSFINELKSNTVIKNISIASGVPPANGNIITMKVVPLNSDKAIDFNYIECDENYKDVLDLKMKKGQFFSKADYDHLIPSAVINETAESLLGIDDIIGKTINVMGSDVEIKGVVKDFYFNSVHEPISATIILPGKMFLGRIAIKITPYDIKKNINFIQTKWKQFYPDITFEYKFIDEELEKKYRNEILFEKIIGFFAMIATLIAIIGLSGLTAYTTVQKFKEVTIRRILGASDSSIIYLLIKEHLLISVISNLITIPIVYVFMNKWLENFVDKITINPIIFAYTFFFTLFITFITIFYKIIKASSLNPIHYLRNE